MVKRDIKTLIFVDCEACGKSPSTGKLTEFGIIIPLMMQWVTLKHLRDY